MPNFSYFSYYFCHFRNITWTNSHGVKTLALSVAPQRPPGRRRCPPGSFSPFRGAPRDRGSPGSLTRHPLKDLWVTRSSGSPHPCRSFRGHGCERLWDAHLWTQVLGGTGSARFVARGTAPPQSGCALRPPPAWHERVSHLRLSLRPPCAAVISPAVTCLD